jgi:hypothetical protein
MTTTPDTRPGETWQHIHNGNTYRIALEVNLPPVKIPGAGWLTGPWVRYANDDGECYLRTLADFKANFRRVD